MRTNRCLLWPHALNSDGYGVLRVRGRLELAHRMAYRLHKGLIPRGKEVDHVCRNRACINPDHLTGESKQDNIHRREGWVIALPESVEVDDGVQWDVVGVVSVGKPVQSLNQFVAAARRKTLLVGATSVAAVLVLVLARPAATPATTGPLRLLATGAPGSLQQAARRWLANDTPVETLVLPGPDPQCAPSP